MSSSVFFKALKWSVAAELISKALQPLIFIVLARLLTPNDYGVVAAAVMVISFTQIFWEAGMAKALIQRQTRIDESASIAFWINLGCGILFTIILFLSADLIALKLFSDIRVGNVLRAMTVQIFLGALASIPTALLQRDLKFDKLFWIKLTTVAVPGVFSIPLAIYGFSYWALVIGTLAGQALQVIVLWNACAWRPTFTYDKDLAKELITFGSWVGLSGLLLWFYMWVDSMFVGSFLGTHQLGIYRTGNQFVVMVFGFMFTPLQPVLYSYFSNIQGDREKLRVVFLKIIRIITLTSVPVAFTLYVLSEPIGTVIFGEKWHGIEFVLGIMALLQGYSWIVGLNGEMYRAIGKPFYETSVNAIAFLVYLGGYYISIQQGFETFVWTRLLLAAFGLLLHLTFSWMAIRLPIPVIIKNICIATLVGITVFGVRYIVLLITADPLAQLLAIGAFSGLLVLGILYIVERNGAVQDLLSFVADKFKKDS